MMTTEIDATATQTTFYIDSETYPGGRVYAGTVELAARVRLMHAQHNDRYARYFVVKVVPATVPAGA